MIIIDTLHEVEDYVLQVSSDSGKLPVFLYFIDGRPASGQSLVPSDLKVGINYVEADSVGSIAELGKGVYIYTPSVAEVSAIGTISVRVANDLYIPTMTIAPVQTSTVFPLPSGITQLPPGFGFLRYGLHI